MTVKKIEKLQAEICGNPSGLIRIPASDMKLIVDRIDELIDALTTLSQEFEEHKKKHGNMKD